MAANTINQLSTANTFQHWLNATELLIATANLLTNGNGEAFYANTRLIVGGSSSNVSLNVQTSATINDLVGNTSNVVTGTFRNLTVTQNVASLNVTSSAYFGQNIVVFTFFTSRHLYLAKCLRDKNVTRAIFCPNRWQYLP